MDDIYRDLMAHLSEVRVKRASMDDVFSCTAVDRLFDEPIVRKASEKPVRRKISSLRDLVGFRRISNDLLVNKSTQDFWKLTKDANGNDVIEKLHDNTLITG